MVLGLREPSDAKADTRRELPDDQAGPSQHQQDLAMWLQLLVPGHDKLSRTARLKVNSDDSTICHTVPALPKQFSQGAAQSS